LTGVKELDVADQLAVVRGHQQGAFVALPETGLCEVPAEGRLGDDA
jgi:hypothetical protein